MMNVYQSQAKTKFQQHGHAGKRRIVKRVDHRLSNTWFSARNHP